ncbi:MAG: response regulator [Balneolales bacterium]
MKRVLIVEDDSILSFLLKKQLTRLGYEVAGRVDTGEKAINFIKELKPDFILMDIKLNGDIDGIEAIAIIKTFSEVPFLYLTGNSDHNTRFRAEKTKPVDYLIKPVDAGVLGEVLASVFK